MNHLDFELTADGSHTLYVPSLNEHYHSVNGAIQESLHVFIDAGLKYCKKDKITVFEVGFGTGLNAYLTLCNTIDSNCHIEYISIERYPLDDTITTKLNYSEYYLPQHKELFQKLHSAEWNSFQSITDNFHLCKIHDDFNSFDFNLLQNIDLIYFDAFAPDKHPEMWTQDIFNKLYQATAQNGILTTYCAKGVVRRMMQESGYAVERLSGPPGKRHMLRAQKL